MSLVAEDLTSTEFRATFELPSLAVAAVYLLVDEDKSMVVSGWSAVEDLISCSDCNVEIG